MLKRRIFLKNTLVASATGAVLSSGLMTSASAKEEAPAMNPFEADNLKDALKAAGITDYEISDDVVVHAPSIAENGAVVTIKVEAKLDNVSEMAVLIEQNPTPYAANFFIGEGATPFVTSRFKMGKTSDVYGVVKVGDKYYANKQFVKVTKGGCGG
ncbi:thiosulfate oxidation carrier protein SoxY [Leucothrix arctica]|uniref:Thiosulfate oxidation carrier protein SoxY n=1 Tax=Leucothrix arctica TaxID=1481894 RepID=A0A317C7N6_9GAMM|nr:thiosulfate oxidation carrier protein SoxY [Leucothrix arctica]PWQ94645.1 thiosulfate oxidation carrier protein SoxY [Leucothrix arctica]